MRDQQRDGVGRGASKAKFELGQVFVTQGVAGLIESRGVDVLQLISRHVRGDWGDLDDEDIRANEIALRQGTRLLSAYKGVEGHDFWVITEWDRSSTTVLLPEEY